MSKRVFVSADWKEPFDAHSWDKEESWRFSSLMLPLAMQVGYK